MPEGPPPDEEQPEDSDDDIPMPEGPPPPKPGHESTFNNTTHLTRSDLPAVSPHPPLPPGLPPNALAPAPAAMFSPPLPPPDMPPLPLGASVPPPPPPGMPIMPPGMSIPPPPVGFPVGNVPPPPPGFSSFPGVPPPPPPGFPPFPPGMMQPPMPAPPPGFYPRRGPNSGAMQDPLSSIPHQTFQAHRAARAESSHDPSSSRKATSGGVKLSTAGSRPTAVSAVISAEPELRDFKKEATAFVPAALKRKKPGAGSKVNAAPSVGPGDGDDIEGESAPAARPDLLSTLQDKFGAPPPTKKTKVEPKVPIKPKDDYDKFLEEMDDILGPKT